VGGEGSEHGWLFVWCCGPLAGIFIVFDDVRRRTAGVAINEIARRVGVASATVRLTLKRLAAAGLGWPLPAEMTDTALEEQLFTAVGKKQGHRRPRTHPRFYRTIQIGTGLNEVVAESVINRCRESADYRPQNPGFPGPGKNPRPRSR
jgi:hypothetical protein